jgi:hypothetical protein
MCCSCGISAAMGVVKLMFGDGNVGGGGGGGGCCAVNG